jgi:hypothetical protein
MHATWRLRRKLNVSLSRICTHATPVAYTHHLPPRHFAHKAEAVNFSYRLGLYATLSRRPLTRKGLMLLGLFTVIRRGKTLPTCLHNKLRRYSWVHISRLGCAAHKADWLVIVIKWCAKKWKSSVGVSLPFYGFFTGHSLVNWRLG